MRPLRLEMKGFSAFREHTEIDLADIDLLALVGPTGSGKSTIIDAITFALYGSVARYQDNRAVAPVINQTSNEARVQLTFELNGEEHVAVRVVKRTKTGASTKEARLERGTETLADDARSMSKRVEALLGLDVEQFNRTVVLPQGRFADFLHDDPSHRQATLRQLLGLDVYVRIGQAARTRAKEKRIQADLLREDLDAGAEELTDERRQAITARIDAVAQARKRFDAARIEHDQAAEARRDAQANAQETAARLQLLDGLEAPEGVAILDDALATATADLQVAEGHYQAARAAQQEAQAAVEQGPDRAVVGLQLQQHDQLAALSQDAAELKEKMNSLEVDFRAATARANEIREEQEELDSAASDAEAAAEDARSQADEAPSITQIDAWLGKHSLYSTSVEALREATEQATTATEPIPAAENLSATIAVELSELNDVITALQERVGIAAYAAHLAVGDACPLCLQEVSELPDHHVDDELAGAQQQRNERSVALDDARSRLDRLRAAANRAEAQLETARASTERAAADLEGLPSTDDLSTMRAEAERLTIGVRAAAESAKAAAKAAKRHRDDPAHRESIETERTLVTEVARVSSRANTFAEQTAAIEQQLQSSPSREQCEQLAKEADELATALREAEEAERATHAEHETARAGVDAARQTLDTARVQLQSTRDHLAALGPPSLEGTNLSANWSALVEWAAVQSAGLEAEHAAAESELSRITSTVSDTTKRAHDIVWAVAPQEDSTEGTMAELGELLAGLRSNAEADLRVFDEEKAKLADLRTRIEALEEEEAVAKKLGHLLRTDGFEGWLMQAALEQLADRATERLLELSNSQYSLVLDDRAFSVRDHANADEVRSARTLSGGETFLASLSLALALAEATAKLAPDGAPRIDSIFLDEGFGTLDPETLDIVASAIEELGASGRMVGIVTHIRDLADRMPVRLEVSKSGGTATVQRVEV